MNKRARHRDDPRRRAGKPCSCHDDNRSPRWCRAWTAVSSASRRSPELILELTEAVHAGDLKRDGDAGAHQPAEGRRLLDARAHRRHARMKLAMVMAGWLKAAHVRPPPHAGRRYAGQIARALKSVGMLEKGGLALVRARRRRRLHRSVGVSRTFCTRRSHITAATTTSARNIWAISTTTASLRS